MHPSQEDPLQSVEFRSYPTSSEAEIDAAYLRSEDIQAEVIPHVPLPGMAGWASVWVARGMHDRAAWLLKFPPVSEAELEYLATGELPVAKPDPPGSDASA